MDAEPTAQLRNLLFVREDGFAGVVHSPGEFINIPSLVGIMSTATALINGALGGLVATFVMTVVMMAAGDDSPPPTANLWSKYVGGEPEENRAPAMILHFVYGTAVGSLLAGFLFATDLTSAVINLGSGIAYGIVLFIVGALFWMRTVIGIEPERKRIMMFLMVHFVYGGVLGVWLAANLL